MAPEKKPQENADEKFESALVVVAFAALVIAIMAWALRQYTMTHQQVTLAIKAFGVPFAGLASTAIIVLAMICGDGWRVRKTQNK